MSKHIPNLKMLSHSLKHTQFIGPRMRLLSFAVGWLILDFVLVLSIIYTCSLPSSENPLINSSVVNMDIFSSQYEGRMSKLIMSSIIVLKYVEHYRLRDTQRISSLIWLSTGSLSCLYTILIELFDEAILRPMIGHLFQRKREAQTKAWKFSLSFHD